MFTSDVNDVVAAAKDVLVLKGDTWLISKSWDGEQLWMTEYWTGLCGVCVPNRRIKTEQNIQIQRLSVGENYLGRSS